MHTQRPPEIQGCFWGIQMNKLIRSLKHFLKAILFRLIWVWRTLTGYSVECNVCGYRANQLRSVNWQKYSTCPRCYSHFRQRLLIASLTHIKEFSFEQLIYGKKVLHFAPEEYLDQLIQDKATTYHTADFLAEGYTYRKIDFQLDISNMPSIADNSYDCVIAFDVLEHVPDHLRGIREVFRVLKNGGTGIFSVPQKDNLVKTYEDLSITDPAEREKQFGQYDHLRIYGSDFKEMLEAAGFNVSIVDEKNFSKDLVKKHVLFPPVISENPLATNHRKVYFARKGGF